MDLVRSSGATAVEGAAALTHAAHDQALDAAAVVAALRASRLAVTTAQAEELRWVARLAGQCRREARERVPDPGLHDVDVLAESLAVDAVVCALGISRTAAAELVDLSSRLTEVLPAALDAWSDGVLDGSRARVLARATEVLDDDTARHVVRQLLPSAGAAPWEGPSPRRWRAMVERAVVRADAAAAARRREAALAARRVRAWAEGDGTGVLQLRADVADITLADEVVSDLARALPAVDTDGVARTMDQRRSDALVAVFRAIRDGGSLPRVPVRRVHDLGLVLHADTLFGDGRGADDTAQLRGLGQPAVVDPVSARRLARRQLDQGDAVQVLVVDATGAVERVVRLDSDAAESCRSREALVTAVRQAVRVAPPVVVDAYEPTEAIARHVRAEAPACSFYDCPTRARACDLDHDTPWPRGPTSVTNLDPKCRRHHNAKTTGLARTRVRAGPGAGPRQVAWSMIGGIRVTTAPDALPGTGEPPFRVPPYGGVLVR